MPAKPKSKSNHPSGGKTKASKLRIIGGSMRARSVTYHGAEFTRPMRDSVRENLFNILGRACKSAIAFDLFAGTGVLGFEAISRGAVHVTAVEPVRQATVQIKKTIDHLGVASKYTLVSADAFYVADDMLRAKPGDDTPWIVFLSPPYSFWEDEETLKKLCNIIRLVQKNAPPGSVLCAETNTDFNLARLPAGDWDIRTYGITRLAFIEPGNVCGMNLPDLVD
ncbi:16S rRNA m(2)G-966 methyltransferase [Neorhodopirellula lusitana]|uniref:16S rRNA m(2)G-966 methyltransferase n=1 Tax=Neorhodopirellula lusitana TaxID=445327 RepID=A0ABY1Q068_9BACT|nr:RsmD family RNA methyltransferase [Neorhodopirellula lusitana]SMP52825.1 16S rRNA m(2)G-966 methyltransferase [Neorhodopirellula lusitana]